MGRPFKDQTLQGNGLNKGRRATWQPAKRLGMLKVPETHVGRWVDGDPNNVTAKLEEGWQFVNQTVYSETGHDKGEVYKDVEGGNKPGGVRYREMVGMMLPKDDGTGKCKAARDEFYHNEMMRNTRSRILMNDQKSKLGGYASKLRPTIAID